MVLFKEEITRYYSWLKYTLFSSHLFTWDIIIQIIDQHGYDNTGTLLQQRRMDIFNHQMYQRHIQKLKIIWTPEGLLTDEIL